MSKELLCPRWQATSVLTRTATRKWLLRSVWLRDCSLYRTFLPGSKVVLAHPVLSLSICSLLPGWASKSFSSSCIPQRRKNTHALLFIPPIQEEPTLTCQAWAIAALTIQSWPLVVHRTIREADHSEKQRKEAVTAYRSLKVLSFKISPFRVQLKMPGWAKGGLKIWG